jgi:hypothetical protein
VFEILNLVREFLYRILGVENRGKSDEVYLFSNALVKLLSSGEGFGGSGPIGLIHVPLISPQIGTTVNYLFKLYLGNRVRRECRSKCCAPISIHTAVVSRRRLLYPRSDRYCYSQAR